MILKKLSDRNYTIKVKIRKRKYNINGVIFKDKGEHNLYEILSELYECNYGFDTGLCSLNRDVQKFLIDSKLADQASRGGLFPTALFCNNFEKIIELIS